MVQDQLVDYVSSQIKLGVSREAVKAALVGAGWAAGDVEDTLKKVESTAKPAAAVSSVSASPAATSVTSAAKPAVSSGAVTSSSAKPGDSQSIRVSDLVSASGSSSTFAAVSPATLGKVNPKNPPIDLGKTMAKGNSFESSSASSKKKGGWVVPVILGILFLAAAAFAGYLYTENSGLSSKIASLTTQTGSVGSQLTTLNASMAALDASNTALESQVAVLNTQNSDLMTNISFVAAPVSSSTPAAQTVSVEGVITQTKTGFTLTTQYGVVVIVQNAKDPSVMKALLAIGTSTSPVILQGTHTPGSQYLSVTEVGGNPVQ